ncbi:hrd3p [Saccharomyces arboricola H-6]|uniref:Hrd3p n=1 Tax=Saccharomyces arboricola (strain H-6 / AS 2.3317 / CBS 10644) TaxID=1160507 RepID=J8PKP9_SACAR|nr:hrd3p [Saccharomyces arboricola H-6]
MITPLLYLCVISHAILLIRADSIADPWPKVQNLLSSIPKFRDPMKEAAMEANADEFVGFYVPMDYSPRNEERKYQLIWQNEISDVQHQIYDMLVQSSEQFNNSEATYVLSQIHLWNYYDFPHNLTLAYEYLEKFNDLTHFTNHSAIFDLAVMYSTGGIASGGGRTVVPQDSARALLYYQRAAELGNLKAKQVLAHKYYSGFDVPRNFNKALVLYRDIAETLKKSYSRDEWDIVFPIWESYNVRISDFENGLLGKGLNSIPFSTVRKRTSRPDTGAPFIVQINGAPTTLQFEPIGRFSINGNDGQIIDEEDDEDASERRIIRIYYAAWNDYTGTYSQSRNCERARNLLELTYKEFEPHIDNLDFLQVFYYIRCLQLLGHMHFTGEGFSKPNIPMAEEILSKALTISAKVDGPVGGKACIDLGLINQYINGNVSKAISYYKRAIETRANNGIVEFQLSKLATLLPEENIGDPFNLMETAYLKGFVPAIYEFAVMTESGVNGKHSVENTAYLFKKFVNENEAIMAPELRIAFAELISDRSEVALWAYSQLAEQGYETAQVSAAYLMYQLPYEFEDPPRTTTPRKTLAISYYTRAFKQGNIDAGVVAGDIYYQMQNYSKAIALYQGAALKYSIQAIWNLGYMHENGLGVNKDFHLAKRYYDQVLEHNYKFYLASKLSVLKLHLKSWLTWITREKVNYWAPKTPVNSSEDTHHQTTSWYTQLTNILQRMRHKEDTERTTENSHKDRTAVQNRAAHRDQEEQETSEILGFQVEDLITMGCILGIFLLSILMSTLAARRGWNVRFNDAQLNANGNQQQQQQQAQGPPGWDFNVQIFAI